ncbi:MAG TPA: hypothetical protein VII44_11180 [Puia sp.]
MKQNTLIPDLSFPLEPFFKTFQEQHENFQSQFPFWSLSATRRRLITAFWLKNVFFDNFLILIFFGTLITWIFHFHQPVQQLITAAPLAYFLAFSSLFIFMYYPAFHIEFLPLLDNCMENYKGKQLEGIQECKRQQHSVIALMLIQHVGHQLAGFDPLINNTANAQLLARQYGISIKSVGSALNLILRGDWDRKSIRKRTEILDDFDSAKEHFKQLSAEKAIILLDQLQQKILQAPPK